MRCETGLRITFDNFLYQSQICASLPTRPNQCRQPMCRLKSGDLLAGVRGKDVCIQLMLTTWPGKSAQQLPFCKTAIRRVIKNKVS